MFFKGDVHFPKFHFKELDCLLAFFWTAFLTFGIFAGSLSAPIHSNSLFSIIDVQVSSLSLLLFRFLYLIASALFVQLQVKWLVIFIASFRAICYGFLLGITFSLFGNSGWLFSLLFYFVTSVSVVLDLWFWSVSFKTGSNQLILKGSLLLVIYITLIILNSFMQPIFSGLVIH